MPREGGTRLVASPFEASAPRPPRGVGQDHPASCSPV